MALFENLLSRTVYSNMLNNLYAIWKGQVGIPKRAIIYIFILGAVTMMQGQTEEDSFMLGTGIGSGVVTSSSNGLLGINLDLNDGAGIDIGLSPKAG